MKKYAVFIVSFVLLYLVFEVLSGWLLTAFYTPDPISFNENMAQEVEFGRVSDISFLATLVVATIAYFLSQKMFASRRSE